MDKSALEIASAWPSLASSLSLPNSTVGYTKINCRYTFYSAHLYQLLKRLSLSSAFKIKLGGNVSEVIHCPPKEFLHLPVFNVVVLVVLCLTVIIFVWLDVTETNKYKHEHKEVEEIINRLCTKKHLLLMCVLFP